MMFAGIALHGICYDFFFVTGFMYADKVAPRAVSGQVQGLLVFVTQGLGMFFGFKVAAAKFAEVPGYAPLDAAIQAARPAVELSFGEKMAKLFSVDLPASIDEALLGTAMEQWKAFWLFPALLATIIAVLFFVAFWDKTKVTADE
jgi:hypothetical protein